MISYDLIELAERYLEWRCLDKNWFDYREKIGKPIDLRKLKFAQDIVKRMESDGDSSQEINDYLKRHVTDVQSGEIKAPMGETPLPITDAERAKMLSTRRSYFSNYLFALMEQKFISEDELAAKARMDTAIFSRMRNERKYIPEERTVWAIVLALELSVDEANSLMYRAKMFLSANVLEEVLMAFFMDNRIYNPSFTDEILAHYGCASLKVTEDFSAPLKTFHDEDLIDRIELYIEENFFDTSWIEQARMRGVKFSYSVSPLGEPAETEKTFDVIVNKLKEKVGLSVNLFSDYLFKLIKQKNLTDVEVYKRAHLDRRIFSKLRNEKTYMPSKKTVVAIAFALKLDFKETNKLLARAGYSLSSARKEDVIAAYFFDNQIYNLSLINEVLDYYDCPILGD